MNTKSIYTLLAAGALTFNLLHANEGGKTDKIHYTQEENRSSYEERDCPCEHRGVCVQLAENEERPGLRVFTEEEEAKLALLMYEAGKLKCEEGTRPLPADEAKAISRVVFYTDHSHSMHHISAITRKGTLAELEDGSIWIINPDDNLVTHNWLTTDTIVITPINSGSSAYRFQMINLNTGASIYVRLAISPLPGTIYTHWAYLIDYAFREVCLEDGSWWKISAADVGFLYDWKVDDYVIIGNTLGVDAIYDNNILINVRLNEYVRASRI